MRNNLKKVTSKLLHSGYSLLLSVFGEERVFRFLTWVSSRANYLLWGEYKRDLLARRERSSSMIEAYLEPIKATLESKSVGKDFANNVSIIKKLLEIEDATLSLLYEVDPKIIEDDEVLRILRDNSLSRLNLLTFDNAITEINTSSAFTLDESIVGNLDDISIKQLIGGKDSLVSVVYPFRDREIKRLELSIKSILKFSSIPTQIVVVDYGSIPEIRDQLVDFCSENKVGLVRVETEGLPWSRSRALNIGIRDVETKYVVTTDIDMLFAGDIIGICSGLSAENNKIHCRPLWLREDGQKSNAWMGDYNQLGGFMFSQKILFDKNGYFNDEIYYWGLEDIEFDKRMETLGIKKIWIDDKVSIYHMWHAPSYGDFDPRPASSWFDSNRELIYTLTNNSTQKNTEKDRSNALSRPVLKLNKDDAFEVKVESYVNQLEGIIALKENKKFIYLNLGNRIVNTNAHAVREKLNYLDNFFNKNGTEISVIKSKNFDYFYLSLSALKEVGLVDYYVLEDYSGVYLLFN